LARNGRADFVGRLDEIRRDVAKARDLGASEIIIMAGYSTGDPRLDEYTQVLEQLEALVRERPAEPLAAVS